MPIKLNDLATTFSSSDSLTKILSKRIRGLNLGLGIQFCGQNIVFGQNIIIYYLPGISVLVFLRQSQVDWTSFLRPVLIHMSQIPNGNPFNFSISESRIFMSPAKITVYWSPIFLISSKHFPSCSVLSLPKSYLHKKLVNRYKISCKLPIKKC